MKLIDMYNVLLWMLFDCNVSELFSLFTAVPGDIKSYVCNFYILSDIIKIQGKEICFKS